MQAEKLYKEVLSAYPKTNAAKMATKGLAALPAIFEADRKVAADELLDTYQTSMGQILDSAKIGR